MQLSTVTGPIKKISEQLETENNPQHVHLFSFNHPHYVRIFENYSK